MPLERDVLVALIAALAPTLVALATLRQTFRNTEKATALTQKTDEIHILVNSNLELVKAQLKAALAEIAMLRQLIADAHAGQGPEA